jgi:chaperonin GroES
MIKVLGKKIVVRRSKKEAVSEGGIILPATVVDAPQDRGEVLAVGPDAKGVKVGDKILWSRFSPIGFIYKNEELLVMNVDDIIGIIPKAGATENKESETK